MPDSSCTSRITASSADSPGETNPAGAEKQPGRPARPASEQQAAVVLDGHDHHRVGAGKMVCSTAGAVAHVAGFGHLGLQPPQLAQKRCRRCQLSRATRYAASPASSWLRTLPASRGDDPPRAQMLGIRRREPVQVRGEQRRPIPPNPSRIGTSPFSGCAGALRTREARSSSPEMRTPCRPAATEHTAGSPSRSLTQSVILALRAHPVKRHPGERPPVGSGFESGHNRHERLRTLPGRRLRTVW